MGPSVMGQEARWTGGAHTHRRTHTHTHTPLLVQECSRQRCNQEGWALRRPHAGPREPGALPPGWNADWSDGFRGPLLEGSRWALRWAGRSLHNHLL